MAAGLGFKDFTTGEVLTAADVDGYLMQGVWVFASAAARDAAVTSPQEGNFAYLKDTNVTTYYTGSAWANLDTTGMTNPMTTTGDTIYSSSGSTPARLGIGSTGQVLTVAGGVPTWASASSGAFIKISTTALSGSSGSISNCFSSTYDNYIVVFSDIVNASGTGDFAFYMRTGSTNTTSGYDGQGFYINNTSVVGYGWTSDLVQAYCTTTRSTAGIIHIYSPYLAKDTVAIMHQSGPDFSRTNFGSLPNTTSYESLGWALGTGTITGNLTIYGLEK